MSPRVTLRARPRTRRRPSLPLLLSLATLLVPALTQAQQAQPSGGAERSAWYMYFGDHSLTATWGLHLEGQFRREDLGQRWEQLLLRPGVTSDFGHGLTAMLAYTYLRDYPFESASLDTTSPTTTGPQPEHRILEELKFKHTLIGGPMKEKAVTLSHRFRAEQRFEGTSTEGIGTTSWDYAERARYRLTADIPFRWSTAGARPDYTSLYNELFVNFGPHGGDHALDQNRTYAALGWDLDKYVQLEVGYLHEYMPTANGVVGEHNHALQITLNSTAPFRRGIHKKQ